MCSSLESTFVYVIPLDLPNIPRRKTLVSSFSRWGSTSSESWNRVLKNWGVWDWIQDFWIFQSFHSTIERSMYMTWRQDGFQGLMDLVVGGLVSVELDGISRGEGAGTGWCGHWVNLCCFDPQTPSYVRRWVLEFETWPFHTINEDLVQGTFPLQSLVFKSLKWDLNTHLLELLWEQYERFV